MNSILEKTVFSSGNATVNFKIFLGRSKYLKNVTKFCIFLKMQILNRIEHKMAVRCIKRNLSATEM